MLFKSVTVSVNFRRYGVKSSPLYSIYEHENGWDIPIECEDFFKGKIKIERCNGVYIVFAEISCCRMPYDFAKVFRSDKSAYIDIELCEKPKGILSQVLYNPFWCAPSFENDLTYVPENIQNMLIDMGDYKTAVLPLCNDSFYASISASERNSCVRIDLSKCFEGDDSLSGTAAIFSVDKNSYVAVRHGFEYAYDKSFIKSLLKKSKKLPDMYKGIGWCTWNAFYHDVNENGILKKMEEFKKKKIPISWIVIDDGWSERSEKDSFMIKSFFEDKKKFPGGLKWLINKLKKEYGVKAVGVWHALTGYWYGVEAGSELHESQKRNLHKTRAEHIIPNGTGAFDFFNCWHKYLKEQGVDFVKIDAQGNIFEFLYGEKNCMAECAEVHLAADKSAFDNFRGNVINCMGMGNLSVFSRRYSALSRSSDDFYPEKPESFKTHIIQNIYNAVFHGNLFFCDFDMWQTDNITARQSSVLRAVSGGPVYISDGLDESKAEYIKPIIDEDGRIIMCDNAAVPTGDCLFKNPECGVLKVYNKIGDEWIVTVFNLSNKRETVKITIKDFEGKGEYIGYSYFGRRFVKSDFCVNIDGGDVEIINFYKVRDGKILLGDIEKYISIGSTLKKPVSVSDLSFAEEDIWELKIQ